MVAIGDRTNPSAVQIERAGKERVDVQAGLVIFRSREPSLKATNTSREIGFVKDC
jgi:ribosomal protein L19